MLTKFLLHSWLLGFIYLMDNKQKSYFLISIIPHFFFSFSGKMWAFLSLLLGLILFRII